MAHRAAIRADQQCIHGKTPMHRQELESGGRQSSIYDCDRPPLGGSQVQEGRDMNRILSSTGSMTPNKTTASQLLCDRTAADLSHMIDRTGANVAFPEETSMNRTDRH
jgi:hypothetical protein